MVFEEVNYLTILLAVVISNLIGLFWYSSYLFGKPWANMSGLSKDELKKMKKEGMTQRYVLGFISQLITCLILTLFVIIFNIKNIFEAIQFGTIIWAGFIAPLMLSSVLYENKKFSLYLINVGFQFVSILFMTIIVALLS